MMRGLTLLFGIILLLALAGYVLHRRMRWVAYLLWGVSAFLAVFLILAVTGVL